MKRNFPYQLSLVGLRENKCLIISFYLTRNWYPNYTHGIKWRRFQSIAFIFLLETQIPADFLLLSTICNAKNLTQVENLLHIGFWGKHTVSSLLYLLIWTESFLLFPLALLLSGYEQGIEPKRWKKTIKGHVVHCLKPSIVGEKKLNTYFKGTKKYFYIIPTLKTRNKLQKVPYAFVHGI